MNHTSRLAAAIASALMLTASHASPVLSATITAGEFAADVMGRLVNGDIRGARHQLTSLRGHGIKWIMIGNRKLDIDSLIDELSGSNPHAVSVAKKLHGSNASFMQCDHSWATKVNLSAPSTVDVFPTSSAGCE